jgi:putative FmdB family regulatory protein
MKPMPIFEYQCSDCEAKFEKIVLSQSTDVQCPDCSSAHIEKLLSSFAVSTGSTRTSSAQAERSCGRGNFT